MARRTLLTASLAVALIFSITSLYVTASSICVKPDIEIWKKFVDDPPPSCSLGTECHWKIEIGVWTSVDLRKAKVYDRFGAELKIDNITTPDRTYTFTYPDYEDTYPTADATVTISKDSTTVGTYELNWRGVTFGEAPYRFRISWTGETHKISFRWYIGKLEADETITVTVGVSTDLNPGGKQEYTSPCEHCINSGAVLKAKWEYKCRWRWVCARSEEVCIKVQCEEPPPAKLIVKKFHDTDDNGIFDEGIDVMITGWEIYVTDPDDGTTSYLTPISLDTTEFGTYLITEDLPDGWEQTAVRVDGVYKDTPTLTVTVEINEGEEHSVLYGNREAPPPAPPRIKIGLRINPIIRYVGSDITFMWEIDSPSEATPVMVELKLTDPDGADSLLFTGMTFPDDFTGDYTWTTTEPTGFWTVRVTYHYTYQGSDFTASASGSFIVLASTGG